MKHIRWEFGDDGELLQVHVPRGWVQLDFYATNAYGNEVSDLNCEDGEGHNGKSEITEILDAAGAVWEFDSVDDGADNQPGYAAILVVRRRDVPKIAAEMLRRIDDGTFVPQLRLGNIPEVFWPVESPLYQRMREIARERESIAKTDSNVQWAREHSTQIRTKIAQEFADAQSFEIHTAHDTNDVYMPRKSGWRLPDGAYLALDGGQLWIWNCPRVRRLEIAARIFVRELCEHEMSGGTVFSGSLRPY